MGVAVNISAIEKANCTGCHACYNACPVQAVIMKEDDEGFLHPKVDESRCVLCGLCLKACPIHIKPTVNTEREAFAAFAKDQNEHASSSSGGIFAVLARYVLRNGGYVCGAAFDETMTPKHILTNKETDLTKLKGTKYVQSKIGDVYLRIRDLLDQGIVVLFSGTPCQVAGLRRFLNKQYSNLLTVDLICHGVPSPAVFRKYLSEISGEQTVKHMSFRDKSNGLSDVYLVYELSNGEVVREKYSDSEYIKGFIQNLTIRPSCFNCQFKGIDRCSDITIGDYWGLNDYHPEMITEMGTSAVIIHSRTGRKYFEFVKKELKYVKSKPESVSFWNTCLEESVKYNPLRADFFRDFETTKVKDNVSRLYKIHKKESEKRSLLRWAIRKAKDVIKHGIS